MDRGWIVFEIHSELSVLIHLVLSASGEFDLT